MSKLESRKNHITMPHIWKYIYLVCYNLMLVVFIWLWLNMDFMNLVTSWTFFGTFVGGNWRGFHHKLHGPWFGNNIHVESIFHRFLLNKHGCHSSTCIVLNIDVMCIVETWMLYAYSYCVIMDVVCLFVLFVHMKVMHTTSMFK